MPLLLYRHSEVVSSGNAEAPEEGTGFAVPGGVESIFEYNGLVMNRRDWWDTFIITDIDGLDDADVRDVRENRPNDHGEVAMNSYYGGRSIVISGRIRAFSLKKMRDLTQSLRGAFGDLGTHDLIIRSGNPLTDVHIPCRKSQKLVIKEAQNNYKFERDFQITLRAPSPFILSTVESFLGNAINTPTSVMINRGNYQANTRIKIFGPVTDPAIVNYANGKTMMLTVHIPAGEVWEVDSAKGTVRDLTNGTNAYQFVNIASEWVTTEIGENNFIVIGSGTGAGSRYEAYWHDTWI